MDTIDLTYLTPYLYELENSLSAIYRAEYMKDYDMKSKESMNIRANDDRVTSISVNLTLDFNKLSLTLMRDDIPIEYDSVWEENGNKIVSSLLPSLMQDWIYEHKDELLPQVKEWVLSQISGGAAS